MFSRRTITRLAVGLFQIPVCTVLPRHVMSRGRPTFTETSRPANASSLHPNLANEPVRFRNYHNLFGPPEHIASSLQPRKPRTQFACNRGWTTANVSRKPQTSKSVAPVARLPGTRKLECLFKNNHCCSGESGQELARRSRAAYPPHRSSREIVPGG